MATLRYDVDVDTRRAEARIGAFALDMRQRITQAVRSLPEIELDANSTPAQRELQRIRTELVALGRQRIGVDIDADAAQRRLAELNAALVALRAEGADIQIDADAAAALAALKLVEEEANAVNGQKVRVKVDVDKSLADSIIQLAQLGRALKTIALPAAGLALIPQTAAIASSIADLTGIAGLLPAALFAGGAAAGTLALGFSHISDALGPTGTPAQLKAVNEAVAQLAPNARSAVAEIRSFAPAWNSLRLDVQQRLFAGLSSEIKGMGGTYLPILRTGLGGVATDFNLSAKGLAEWARSAPAVRDVQIIFDNTGATFKQLVPLGANVAAAITSIGAVGSTFLPQLAAGATAATARFREFIDKARESGQLGEWIQTGIDKTAQLGRVVGNTAGIFTAFFGAANKGGADFLDTAERITAELDKFLHSDVAQSGLVAFFREINGTISAILPGVHELEVGAARALLAFANTGGLHEFGTALSAIASAVAPLLPALGTLAGQTLHGLAAAASAAAAPLGAIVDAATAVLGAIGPVGPAVLAAVIAFKALGVVGSIVTGLGAQMAATALQAGVMTEAMTGSAAAGTRVATAGAAAGAGISKVGAALPIVGAALIGVMVLFDQFGPKAEDAANKVIAGSKSMAAAIQEEADRNRARIITWDDAAAKQEAYANASATVTAAVRDQLLAMDPLQRATTEVAMAEANLNDALRTNAADSREVTIASSALDAAKRRLQDAEQQHGQAVRNTTDALVAQTDAANAAANADIALQQASLRTADAEDRARQVMADHTASARDHQRALLDVTSAALAEAAAAGRKAQADAEATGASNAAAQGSAAYTQRLIDLASQAQGPTRAALLTLIANLDTTRNGSNNAALASAGLTGEINRIPASHATTVTTPGLDAARAGIRGLTTEILNIQGKSVSIMVSALGSGGLASAGRLASGGILPGFTPGRDVHRFIGPAGTLDLSGGEAVMRPEFTAAVGAPFVHSANAAARAGGISAVRAFMQRHAFADGGIFGEHQSFADGGVVLNVGYTKDMSRFNAAMAALENAAVQLGQTAYAKIQAAAAAAAAAITGGGAPAAGGSVSAGGAMGWIIQHESGGNPTAQNPTSTASGLFQMINGTWKAYGGSTPTAKQASVAEQTAVATRYVNARYGGWPQAQAFWQAHGYYARGGIIPTHLADTGALIPSGHAAINLSGSPERMLSPAETRYHDARGTGPTSAGLTSKAVAEGMSGLRDDVRALQAVLANRGGDTFNVVTADNAEENAQRMRLALRLR